MNRVAFWFGLIGTVILLITGWDMIKENSPKTVSILSSVKIDGNIQPGEYTHHFIDKKNKYELYWRVIGKDIYFGLHSPKKGWVAVGLGGKKAMLGADIYIAYVKNGKTYIREDMGNSPFSHMPVTGENTIEAYAGKVCSKGTFVEFKRKLSGMGKTVTITNKPMRVIYAYANTADFNSYHGPGSRGITQINFLAKAKEKKSGIGMLVEDVKSYQIAGIIWGVLFLFVSFIAIVTSFLEGRVESPVFISKEPVGLGPFAVLSGLAIFDILLVVLFVILLFVKTTPTLRGLIAASVFLILSIIVALYKYFYIDEEVVVHELDDELPW